MLEYMLNGRAPSIPSPGPDHDSDLTSFPENGPGSHKRISAAPPQNDGPERLQSSSDELAPPAPPSTPSTPPPSAWPSPPPKHAPKPPGRLRRTLARIGAGIGLLGVFALSALGGAALHLDTSYGRRAVRTIANKTLATTFKGAIVVGEIERISLIDGLDVQTASVLDPTGKRVMLIEGMRVRTSAIAIAKNAIFGGDRPLEVGIPFLRIDNADVLVEKTPTGDLNLADAFTPRPSPTPTKPQKPAEKEREIIVDLAHLEIGQARIHGQIAPPQAIDTTVDHLAGAVRSTGSGLSLDIEDTDLRDSSALPFPASATVNYHLRTSTTASQADKVTLNEAAAAPASAMKMWGDLSARLGEIGATGRFLMDGDRVDADVDIPHVTPFALASIVPNVPLRWPGSVKVRASGFLPDLQVDASVQLEEEEGESEPASVDIDGDVHIGTPVRADARVSITRFDPRAFGETLPAAEINAFADGQVEIGDKLRAVVFVHTQPLQIVGQAVPALDVNASIDGDQMGGSLEAHEPGMPVRGSFARIQDGVRFDAQARARSLRDVPRLAAPIDGGAEVAISGKVQGGQLDAAVRARVSGVRAPGDVELSAASVNGRVHGPLDKLAVNADVAGQGLQAGSYQFQTFNVATSGPITAPQVRATFRSNSRDFISVSGTVDPPGKGARGVALRVEKDGQVLSAKVARVGARRGGVAVEGLSVRGDAIEALDGSIVFAGGDLTGKLRAENIDIARLVQLSGQPSTVKGIASVDLALEKTRRGHNGHISVALEHGEASILSGVSSMISVAFADEKVTADGYVRLVAKPEEGQKDATCCPGEIAALRISGSGDDVRGPLLSPETWSKVSGSAKIGAEDLDLACLANLVPGALPLSELAGKLTARLTIAREAGQKLASIRDLSIRTRGLKVAGPRKFGEDQPEWASTSVDVNVDGSYDAATGTTNAGVSLFDRDLIVDVRTTAELDVPALLADPRGMKKLLMKTPIAGHISIPRRDLRSFSTLPFVSGASIPATGDVRVDAYFAGTPEKPSLAVRALGWALSQAATTPPAQGGGGSAWTLPLDLDTLITYDSEKGTLEAHAMERRRELLRANAALTAKLSDILSGKVKDPKAHAWKASLEAKLAEAPLAAVAMLAAHNVGGHLSGSIAVRDLNDSPKVAVDLEAPDLKLGPDLYFETARVSVHIDPTKQAGDAAKAAATETAAAAGDAQKQPPPAFSSPNTGVAKIELAAHDGGRLGLVGYAGVIWQDGLTPSPDRAAPADVYLSTKRFRLEAIQPFVASVLSRLDGYLDGDLRLGWNRVSNEKDLKVESDLALNEGVFHVPALGQEFRDAHFRLIAKEGGVIRLDDIGARALTGDLKGWAMAQVKGFKLQHAAAELTIGEKEALPLAVEGVPLGSLQGKLSLTASSTDDTLVASVRLPNLRVDLPSSIGRSVQSLDDNPDIDVRQPLGPPKEEPETKGGMKVALTVEVGKAQIAGSMLKITLDTPKTAPIHVAVDEKPKITGTIELVTGELNLLGKRFEVERGLINFQGKDDPNPFVNVTVRWDVPDGSHIYIDYVGTLDPITDEKIHFRSDPPKSKQEIITTLLLGSEYEHGTLAGGGMATEQQGPKQSTGSAAGGLAAGFIAGQLSNIFADSGIKTSLGTTESGALKTGLAYERGQTRTQITYEGASNGAGAHSSAPGRTTGGGSAEVSLDWRFHKNWVVRGMVRVGEDEPSSGVDVLWQYRY